VWGVLKVLDTFPVRTRPQFEEVADKLEVQDSSFISQGWEEAKSAGLVSSQYYQSTELSDRGRKALEFGFIECGKRKEREEPLYFFQGNGQPVPWKHEYEIKEQGNAQLPKWSDKLNEASLCRALDLQAEVEELKVMPDERVLDVHYHWATAIRVKLDGRGKIENGSHRLT
jgi:hypothetical protein